VKFSIVVSEFCSPLSEAITSSGTKLKKTLILESAVVHYWQAPGPRDRPNHMLSISTDRRCHFIITERVEGEGGERERERRDAVRLQSKFGRATKTEELRQGKIQG